MWIYDGEDWIEEGANERDTKSDRTSRPEQFYPELQVIEIVPLPNTDSMPPLPLP